MVHNRWSVKVEMAKAKNLIKDICGNKEEPLRTTSKLICNQYKVDMLEHNKLPIN